MRWIIGDIHGMLRPLQGLLREVARRDPWAHLLFVGDYVNRGPDARGVIEQLVTLRNAHYLRGNHDDVFDLILHGTCYAPTRRRTTRSPRSTGSCSTASTRRS